MKVSNDCVVRSSSGKRFSNSRSFVLAGLQVGAAILIAIAIVNGWPTASAAQDSAITDQELNSWSGVRAMNDIAKQLSFGTRAIGTRGHQTAIDWIKAELASAFATIVVQDGSVSGPEGTGHQITNIIGRFDLMNRNRIVVGTHYDSIVRAYADARDPNDLMPGANNSASGVAVLLETIRTLRSLGQRPPVGIDFVFFDGEEGSLALGAGDPNWRALGSPYFITRLQEIYRGRKPIKSVIFDMVCYNKLVLRPEPLSLQFAEKEVTRFWSIGHKIAPSIFIRTVAPAPISDDHTALANAGIPSFLVIGFEYDPWFNTTMDTIDKCSAESLEAVGRTLMRYLFLNPNL